MGTVAKGKKTIEGRVGHEGKFDHLVDEIIVVKKPKSDDNLSVKVTDVKHYDNLVDKSGWEKITPYTKSRVQKIRDKNGNTVFSDENVSERGGMNAIYMKLQ